jgi:hypothetical protein
MDNPRAAAEPLTQSPDADIGLICGSATGGWLEAVSTIIVDHHREGVRSASRISCLRLQSQVCLAGPSPAKVPFDTHSSAIGWETLGEQWAVSLVVLVASDRGIAVPSSAALVTRPYTSRTSLGLRFRKLVRARVNIDVLAEGRLVSKMTMGPGVTVFASILRVDLV